MAEERIKKILSLLEKAYPDVRLVLHYRNPLELLVATILAAQCTDERVNKVTETLFKKYTSAKDYANVKQEVFEEEIRSTGFYKNKPTGEGQIYHTSSYIREYNFIGLVTAYDKNSGIATIEQRNRMFAGEEIEVVRPNGAFFKQIIHSMKNIDGEQIDVAPHPQMIVYMPLNEEVGEYTMLRRQGK